MLKVEVLRRAFGTTPFTVDDARKAWGIKNPDSTLNRLKQAGVIERIQRGTYRITSDDAPLSIERHLERATIQSLRRKRDQDLPDLARARWQNWLDTGYLKQEAPRRFRVTPPTTNRSAHVRIR